jgi:hypothetical protein
VRDRRQGLGGLREGGAGQSRGPPGSRPAGLGAIGTPHSSVSPATLLVPAGRVWPRGPQRGAPLVCPSIPLFRVPRPSAGPPAPDSLSPRHRQPESPLNPALSTSAWPQGEQSHPTQDVAGRVGAGNAQTRDTCRPLGAAPPSCPTGAPPGRPPRPSPASMAVRGLRTAPRSPRSASPGWRRRLGFRGARAAG